MFTHTKNKTRIQNVSLTTIFSCWFNVRLFYGFHLQNVCSLLAGSFWWHESRSVWDRLLTQTGNLMNSWLLVNNEESPVTSTIEILRCFCCFVDESFLLRFSSREWFVEFWKFSRGRKGNNEVVTVEFQKDWIDPLKLIPEGIAPWRIFFLHFVYRLMCRQLKEKNTNWFLGGKIISRI